MGTPAALSLGSCNAFPTTRASNKVSPRLPPECLRPRRSGFPSPSCSHARRSSVIMAVAVDSSGMAASPKPDEEAKPIVYHFLVANAKFMLDEEEHFKEQLYERLRHFGERNRKQDFWLVIEPKFLERFPELTKRLNRPAVALVSTDGPWIKFMKLRLDRVLEQSFLADSLENALATNPVNLHFEKPATWTAPYPKYGFGWWDVFLPPKAE